MNKGGGLSGPFEKRAVRVYNICLLIGLIGLGLGLIWRALDWLGIAALIAAPIMVASMAWLEQRQKPELNIGLSIALALSGLLLAVLLGYIWRH